MSFTPLLIHSCSIQAKTLSTSGYEKTASWQDVATEVACRKDSAPARIQDGDMRINYDDDMFFFNPDVQIERGNRIVFDGDHYDVIDVNKVYDSKALHHLEVTARNTDHD